MTAEFDVFEVMRTCRAMRRLKPDPVPEPVLLRLVEAATWAPSGSNVQNGRWLVVRDAEQRARIAALNRRAVEAYVAPGSRRPAALPHQDAERRQRQLRAVLWQARHMHEAPALIVACLEVAGPRRDGAAGNIWPGIQNLLLAARALGLGAAPTTLALADRTAFKEVVGLPEDIEPYCLIPVGYPMGRFGPVSRRPVSDVLRWDRWS